MSSINFIEQNAASGRNIDQVQSANICEDSGSTWGHPLEHHSNPHYIRGPDFGDAHANVVQVNQAPGNNIDQLQFADVNVNSAYPYGHYSYANGEAQANVVQVNQAAGKNIDQFQFADVNAGDAFGGHNSYYEGNTVEGVVNAVQVNQASGHNIDLFQNLDIGVGNYHTDYHSDLDGLEEVVILAAVM